MSPSIPLLVTKMKNNLYIWGVCIFPGTTTASVLIRSVFCTTAVTRP